MALREGISERPPFKFYAFEQRVQSIYQQGAVRAQSDGLLSQAFEELAHALDVLQAAEQALHRQREQELNAQAA